MPLYNPASTARALNVPSKWLDNLLSHNKIDGVQQARQGITRRLSLDAITVVETVYRLNQAGIPVSSAVALAQQLCLHPDTPVQLSDTLTLSLDVPALRHSIVSKLTHAVEVTPHPARGRPKLGPK